jgi:D-aspartate ligase
MALAARTMGRGERRSRSRVAESGSEPPALVFGGDVTGLAVIRSLGRSGVPVAVASSDRNLARSRWYRSAPGEPIEELSDGRRVVDYLRNLPFPRAVLIPATDHWALALASLPASVAQAYPATVAGAQTLQIFIDKERFASAAEEFGVPAPRTVHVTGVESLDEVAEADLPGFFLKPRDSQLFAKRFGVKGLRLAERSDAAELVRKVASEQLEVVLQEFIPGPPTAHVFLDGYVDRAGVMRACLARRRLRMHPAEFGNSTLSVTIPLDDVSPALEGIRRLFDGTGFVGFFDAEFKHDARDGRFKIFEVNPRPWWQLELAEASGLDLCLMAYRDALGLPISSALEYRVGRRWVHPLPDFRAWWAGRKGNGNAGGFPLRSWVGGANALFSRDDPMPGVGRVTDAARRAAARAWSQRR